MIHELIQLFKSIDSVVSDGSYIVSIQVKMHRELSSINLYEFIPNVQKKEYLANMTWMEKWRWKNEQDESIELVLAMPSITINSSFKQVVGDCSVNEDELNDYLLRSGDDNSIHKGSKAVVPALLLLEKISNQVTLGTRWKCQFKSPLRVNQKFSIEENRLKSDNKIIATWSVK